MNAAKVLIIEDSLGIANALGRALSLVREGDYDVITCPSGETALEQLEEQVFDLIITDLRLPGIDGLEILEWVHHHCPQMRSILITAYGSPQVEERAKQLANAYMPKPFRLNDLIQLVQHVLETPLEMPAQPSDVSAPAEPPSPKIGNHLTILASDLDGTLAEDGRVAPETWQALRRAKASGMTIFLVTGRSLETFITDGPFAELCEAIVAENGAIVYFPRRDSVAFPFGRITPAVLQRLDSLNIPLERGMAIVATVVPHDYDILETLRIVGGGATVEYNKGHVMVLPLGATKGTGLQYALRELGFSAHNVLACGDAENDCSLFETAEYAAAVSNAPSGIKALADTILPEANGKGVRGLLDELLSGRLQGMRSRPHRQMKLGRNMQGSPVQIDPFSLLNQNLGIFGASSSGKSWLAGLLTEELLRLNYQVCIIDPEGDYRALAAGPHTLLLGGSTTPLPSVADVVNFMDDGVISLILDLSSQPGEQNNTYIYELLLALQSLRGRRGRPHWFLLDEAQNYFLDDKLSNFLHTQAGRGGFGLVSYRPSLIPQSFLGYISNWLLTRLNMPEDIEAIRDQVRCMTHDDESVNQLPDLPIGQALLCTANVDQWVPPPEGIVRFHVGQRSIPHIRHLHKYLRAPLPAPKRFYFHDSMDHYLGRSAANMWDFCQSLRELPNTSMQYHLLRGDFERWFEDVLNDKELARRIHKINNRGLPEIELRRALLEAVESRYHELETLA
jgi:hydroxymethylpyrimidine pyrophosphatase-like HAD family hydrolase/CheY-like chemotaxis protein